MTRTPMILALPVVILLVSFGTYNAAVPPEGPAKSKDEIPRKPAEPNPLKLPTRKEAMAMKLKSSQGLLEGIAMNDFDGIQKSANNLIVVSNLTDFLNAYKGEEYQFHVKIFRRPAETIIQKAKEKNMDGVMVAYNDLTLSCLKCHIAMRDKKFEIQHVPERFQKGE